MGSSAVKITALGSAILGATFALAVNAAPAHAQATRTWVASVPSGGDDANPCSRTAPCKTFAGAISKTAASGEINVLDPGGFGAVTITKSITISSEGFEAGVLVSGTNGIIINAGAYTHTSVAIRDAIAAIAVPVVEVHISNIFAREKFRHQSHIAPVAKATLSGFGVTGYALAISGLAAMTKGKS